MLNKNNIVFFITVIIFITSNSFAQISPGDLVKAHAHLEGMSNCTKCHTLGDKVSNEKCLDCHTDIRERVNSSKGYHASKEVVGKDCFSCHNDHHGRNFQIIHFDTDTFNHDLTGYKLVGAHSKQSCKDCHQPNFITDQKIKEKESSYLGLNTSCIACHDDYHQKTLSSNCTDCHDFEHFKPASKFDHNNTQYILKGKHKDVACVDCHKIEKRKGRDYQEFAGTEFNNCTSCHPDVHNNQFGQNCRQCHTEESFNKVKGLSNFDHSRTRYALEGKHQFVDCKSCHKDKYTDPLAFNRCMDCHADFHENQFRRENKSPDCSDCHSVNGFPGSSYTIERHKESAFPLLGAHEATPCFVCHKKEEKWKFREIGINCTDCHQDIHKEYIDPEFYPESDCKKCHVEDIWSKIDFDHNTTEFELEGVHKEQSCRSCHFPQQKNGLVIQQFSDLSQDCKSCHLDIHYNQFDVYGITNCTDCHEFENWKASRFDHTKTRFVLDGKHENLACVKCHKEKATNQATYIEYKLNYFKCVDCH
ncbi:MAG: cytochrome C [Bacteroidales bacterium]|nr:cytochrome C [Bacteroidales bacterium]